ncbi:MAG: pallilysin-related adhesin [Spirochaetales bacterium]|nr:pallilysin-related adhesin [Spirochaetales bacterium]
MRCIFTIAALAALIAGCTPDTAGLVNTEPKEIIPSLKTDAAMLEESSPDRVSTDEKMQPKIAITKDTRLIDIRTENLDLDRSDEQILLVETSNNGITELWVVDYDAIKDMYFISYKQELSSAKLRRYQIMTEDLVGDHIPEILCFGTDTDKTQSLDVFRKSVHPTGIGLYYSPVFRHEIQGTIEILRKDRDASYREGISNGKSFSIETYIHDNESDDYNDLVRSSYFFRYQTNSYVLVDTEKIPGNKVDEEKLRLLYTKGPLEYHAFLNGPWYKTDGSSHGSQNPVLVNFDDQNKRISYFEEGSQEILIWTSSSKPLYNRLVIYGLNELIPDLITRILTVAVTDLNTIQIYGAEPWRGSYGRYTEGLQKEYLQRFQSQYTAPEVSGIYASTDGGSIEFFNNSFTLQENGKTRSGGYAFYLKGNPILSMKIISERGILLEDRVYKYDFFEEEKENKIIRTLVLFPGKMSVRGFVPTADGYSQYQQIETVETATETETDQG